VFNVAGTRSLGIAYLQAGTTDDTLGSWAKVARRTHREGEDRFIGNPF